MSKIKFIVVGNTRSSFLRQGELFYLERIQRYAPAEWIEVTPQKVTKGRSKEEILRIEAQSIAKKCLLDDHIIALDLKGKEYDSEGLAALVEQLSQTTKRICFVIGGPLGLSRDLLDTAAHSVALSRLTLTHEMSRLVLLEQIYRAHTIIKGEKYHK
jgi:23S rRNA (pseudouridine1915-N3)-methyltransferase